MNNWKTLDSTQYDIEIWHKDGTYVADISHIVTSGINMSWVLNDVEDLSFSLDLVQFKQKCKKMGVEAKDVLIPYIHDIRIRRNGEYILGCQVVDLTININNNSGSTLDVKCTGFLNLFKDLYMSADWNGYTYAEMARKLVKESQEADNLINNGTFDINTEGWSVINGRIEHIKVKADSHSGQAHLRIFPTNISWGTVCTRLHVPAGTRIKVDLWWNGHNGRTLAVRERETANRSQNQRTVGERVGTGSGWLHDTFEYTTVHDYGFLCVEGDVGNGGQYLWIDDIKATRVDDNPNLGITLGTDTAISFQSSGRQRAYSLQSVKEALKSLTSLQSDNFDFDFTYDRKFNTYHRKGKEKPDIIASYPGNITSMSITRSASSLANKVTIIGSGIGDERLEVTHRNKESIQKYGVRERTVTANNVTLKATLNEHAIGELWDRKDVTNLPSLKIDDGSINPGNIEIGDSIMVRVENDSYIEDISGMYRVVKMTVSVGMEHQESVSLTLEPKVTRPKPVMVRYIKNTLNGNTRNNSNHLVELQALQLVGNDLFNIAQGKTFGGTVNLENPGVASNNIADTNSFTSFGDGRQSIWVDLGKEYPIDYVKVWHYFADGRAYNENVLSVGRTLTKDNEPLEHILWDFRTGEKVTEMDTGMISPWIQELNL